MPGKNPERRPGFLQVEEEGISAGLEILAVDLYVVGKCDGRALIRSGAPRCTLSRAKAFVHEAVVHQLTPYVSCAIVGRRVVDAWTVIRNGNFDGANPLRDLCALCVTVRGDGQFRGFLCEGKRKGQDNHQKCSDLHRSTCAVWAASAALDSGSLEQLASVSLSFWEKPFISSLRLSGLLLVMISRERWVPEIGHGLGIAA